MYAGLLRGGAQPDKKDDKKEGDGRRPKRVALRRDGTPRVPRSRCALISLIISIVGCSFGVPSFIISITAAANARRARQDSRRALRALNLMREGRDRDRR